MIYINKYTLIHNEKKNSARRRNTLIDVNVIYLTWSVRLAKENETNDALQQQRRQEEDHRQQDKKKTLEGYFMAGL